ncbi:MULTISPECIES: LysR family transcriptional regulator [Psychrobacter]|uniref:LysR family transcriptional regulator n=1 Tax=Bacteria TaxID=2 RepID=UPI000C7A6BF5|nr:MULTISPECIES: LysR family transcriptional regulator [Psychrobacter]PKG67973.1 LysR family transcriptional regulator [Psychrobacter sp. Choline-02u-13]PKG88052.1 LysR family transcriptional regulator [Psychrobacter sp. Sarcosine-02u-2]PKH55079.1 LysR family transcriptional regulator [Psychrobacter sp. Choline-02u-9]TDL30331.1 LysR family transcriptional regulator [Jeotgalibacillus sp. S-D1]|tara:strand:+ start:1610 stop:2482 length:873 start_codon:yes stop_codon:yes gene_type:complete
MKWDGISEFVYVAEYESFTKAAKKIGISTAQVSRQVSALEQRLNIKLLYRTTRKVSLTEEGRVFYQHCRGVLDGLDAAEQAVTNLQSKPQGMIKLTTPVTYGEQQLMPLVNDFMVQYSDIEVTAFLSNQQVDLIEEGYDLAIRIGKLRDSTMMAKKLSSRTNFVCAAPSYIEKYGIPHSLTELGQHNCLLGTLDYWHFKESGKEKNIRVTGSVRYNSGYSLVDAAIKGLGIVQLPDYYVQKHLESGELVSLLDNLREPEEAIWALYPHNRHLSPKIRLLLDYLAAHLSKP